MLKPNFEEADGLGISDIETSQTNCDQITGLQIGQKTRSIFKKNIKT